MIFVSFKRQPLRSHSPRNNLALRARIVQWQPQLRAFFLTRIALWKYRMQLPGFRLPPAISVAQQEFDHTLAQKLDAIANYMEREGTLREQTPDTSLERLEQTIQTYSSKESNVLFAARFQAFLSLCRTAEDLTVSLDTELKASGQA